MRFLVGFSAGVLFQMAAIQFGTPISLSSLKPWADWLWAMVSR